MPAVDKIADCVTHTSDIECVRQLTISTKNGFSSSAIASREWNRVTENDIFPITMQKMSLLSVGRQTGYLN
jgi:hypothetical protein